MFQNGGFAVENEVRALRWYRGPPTDACTKTTGTAGTEGVVGRLNKVYNDMNTVLSPLTTLYMTHIQREPARTTNGTA